MFCLLALQTGYRSRSPAISTLASHLQKKKKKNQTLNSSILCTKEQICQEEKQFPVWPAQNLSSSELYREKYFQGLFSPKRARGHS